MENIRDIGHKYMYSCGPQDLHFTPNHNDKVAKRQRSRFEHACRHLFNKVKLRPGTTLNHAQCLSIVKKHKFLFFPSQKFKYRISHLTYKKARITPSADDYKFKISFRLPMPFVPTSTPLPIEEDVIEGTVFAVLLYNPTSNMFIPLKYRNIIPSDPLYDQNGCYIIPGSREWEHEAIEQQRLRSLQQSLAQATYHGTSPKYLKKCWTQTADLLSFSDTYHRRMSYYNQDLMNPHYSSKQDQAKIRQDIQEFIMVSRKL
ncbi:hypothetical protein RirG_178370 [Rhizophagus irregularis DAOM 197198w]|uniref:DUF8211 domain-containing protein n=1 Tax=Rhizophagus irregularis (strain DAOM 197198w) TaxID=1432141 RepID=A0A015KLP1_RHIIW|nr:hypothetical protein RirG_178370 [Rhizophagus irregularis DAOM 197198w]